MKKTLLLLMMVIAINAFAQAPNLYQCDATGSGIATFDLTTQTGILLNGNSPNDFTVNYFVTLVDAENNANPIVNSNAFMSMFSPQQIFARVENNANGQFVISNFTLFVNAFPILPGFPDVVTCESYTLPQLDNGQSYFTMPGGMGFPLNAGDVVTSSQQIYVYASSGNGPIVCSSESSFVVIIMPTPMPLIEDAMLCGNGYLFDSGLSGDLSFSWSLDGVIIAGATQSTFLATMPGTYTVYAQPLGGGNCTGSSTAILHMQTLLLPDVSINGQTVTVNPNAGGTFNYTLDGVSQQSNVFYNVSFGTHIVLVENNCGTFSMVIDIITPDAPSGSGLQTFTEGQTLADIVVNGQNIQWYANPNSTDGRVLDTPLSLSTVLTNNTTYYASQTINGIESVDRLPVAVTLTLGLQNNGLQHLSFGPNPVTNTLKISNQSVISQVLVYNLVGQILLKLHPNSTQSEVSLENLNSGIYLVKVASENAEKTIRIIKK